MVELLGTEIEWSISPPELYFKRGKGQIDEYGEEYHDSFSEFASSTEISLRHLDSLFLRLCKNVKNLEKLILQPYKIGNNRAYFCNGALIYKDPTGHF